MNRSVIKKTAYFFLGSALSLAIVFAVLFTAVPSDIRIFADETKVFNLPLKEVTIRVVPEKLLMPGGQSVGVKMDVKGVLIVGLEEIPLADGNRINPGLLAGLQIGDSVLSINGEKVDSAQDVQEKINREKKEVRLKIMRKGETKNISLKPVLSSVDHLYKMGIWVRDRTAGLGTLTFYDPDSNTFGALGHAITDPDTGAVLSVEDGELLHASVESVKHGKAGEPGEIRGIFYEADSPMGQLVKNSGYGIFGTSYAEIENPWYSTPLSVGYQNEVEKGPAYILATLSGNRVERYSVEIEKINLQSSPDTKSMVIRVTDDRLLKESGGIVQGMSGSPIIQNNKMIGAVTHVFVNDPSKGYGIFIEWMLREADNVK